ncbi:DUF5685 family protein, partial [Magnetococcales bacterium HHB-1]
MQGFIKIHSKGISCDDRKSFFISQCGLCESLKSNYGSISRFLVNRDAL